MENSCYMNRCVLKQKYIYIYVRYAEGFLERLLLP